MPVLTGRANRFPDPVLPIDFPETDDEFGLLLRHADARDAGVWMTARGRGPEVRLTVDRFHAGSTRSPTGDRRRFPGAAIDAALEHVVALAVRANGACEGGSAAR